MTEVPDPELSRTMAQLRREIFEKATPMMQRLRAERLEKTDLGQQQYQQNLEKP